MIHKLIKLPAVSAIALAAATLTTSAGQAAENRAILDSVNFQAQSVPSTIRVISTDGVQWNAIQDGNVSLRTKQTLETEGAGFVRDVGIVLGECAGLSCQGLPYVWKEATLVRDYAGETNLEFPTSLIPVSTPELTASIPLGDQLISRCNEKLTTDGPVAAHTFKHPVRTTFVADTDQHDGNLAAYDVPANENPDVVPHADFARSASVMVKVVCEAPSGIAQNDSGDEQDEPKVADLPQPQPDVGGAPVPLDPDLPLDDGPLFEPPFDPGFPGDHPPLKPLKITGKLKLREYAATDKTKPRLGYGVFEILTNKPGKTGWKVSCTGGRQWSGKKLALKVGPKKWRAVAKVNFHIAKTELVKCKLRSTSKFGHPVLDTAQRLYKVTPVNPGIGDELVDAGDPLKITGVLGLFELPGTNKTKPRNAQAKFAVFTNRPGKTSWKLACSGGRNYSGTHTVTKIAFKSYRLRLKRTFNIAKSELVKCVLRSKTLNNKFLAKDDRYYKVIFNLNPQVGGGPGDLVNPLDPTHDEGKGPIVVNPIVGSIKPVCIGGSVISTRKLPPKHSCLCPSTKKKRKIGRNAFKCSAKFAKVKPGKLKQKLEAAKRLRELRRKEAAKRAALKRAKANRAAQKVAAAKRAAAKRAAIKRAAAKKAAAKRAAIKRAAAKKAAAKRAAAKRAAIKRAAAKKAAAKRAAAKRAALKRAAAKKAAAKVRSKRLQAQRKTKRGLKVKQRATN